MTPTHDAAPPDPPGVDLAALTTWLRGTRPDLLADGPLRAALIAGGRSNLTYRVDGGRVPFVLRRPPLGHVLATAHDMGREYRVVSALAGSAVPVPEALALCADDAVLGAPFYLMGLVDGRVLRDTGDLAGLSADGVRALGGALVDVLADLHLLDVEAHGLADFGRPDGYLERQVRRWGRQLDSSRSRDVAGIEDLRAGLAAAVPVSPAPTVIHGDYRLDNVMVAPDDLRRVVAVLDWEMATLGDPLADLGLLVVYRNRPSTPGDPVSDAMAAPGFPTADELVAHYARRTGTDVSDLSWYAALGFFKLAVVLEGIHYRFVQGQTVGAGFDRIGLLVEPLVAGGLAALRRDEIPAQG